MTAKTAITPEDTALGNERPVGAGPQDDCDDNTTIIAALTDDAVRAGVLVPGLDDDAERFLASLPC